jgi:hypothetical protein
VLLPVGSGYLDLHAGLTPEAVVAAVETGWKPYPWLTAYGEGSIHHRFGYKPTGYVGLGVRGEF